MLYTVFLRRARLTNAQNLAEDYRSFGVVWMSREVSWRSVDFTYKLIIIVLFSKPTFRSKNKCFLCKLCKFDVSMELVKTVKTCLKFLCAMCPDKENFFQYI